MSGKVVVAGVGMIPFAKPGRSETYNVMGAEAARRALADAGLAYEDVQQAYAGYVYGDSTSGQRAVYHLGLSGIPVFNVNNNCSTGSSALFLARQAVEGGVVECVLAVGFEQMETGALSAVYTDRPDVLGAFADVMNECAGYPTPKYPCAQMFGGGGREYAGSTAPSARRSPRSARRRASTRPTTPTRCSASRSPSRRSSARRRSSIRSPATSAARRPAAPRRPSSCSDEFAKKHGIARPRRTSPPRR